MAALDQDKILRSMLGLVRATLRTNYFQGERGADGARVDHDYLSLKLDPREVPDLPAPRPRFEIFVYSPRVEGVHLRFGSGRPRRACAGRTAATTSAPRSWAWSRRRWSRTP